jgi:hypothetical protein
VTTLDADFHALLVRIHADGPSTIRLRMDLPAAETLADLLGDLVQRCREDLIAGAMVSTDGRRVRVRRLPVTSSSGGSP